MKGKYVTVRCPVCNNAIELKATGLRTDFFTCPVCLEGEIKYRKQPALIYKARVEPVLARC